MANGAIPSRSIAEARKRHRGQLVQWDASSKTGYVQLEKPYLDVDVAELWAHDLRKYRTQLEEGQYLNFVIGIEPQAQAAPCLRCGDAVPSRSRSPRARTGASSTAQAEAHEKIQFEEDDDADSQIEGFDLGDKEEDEQCFAAPEDPEDAKSEASDEPERLQREADEQRLEELNRYREDRPRRVLLDWTPRTGRICDWNADATEGWIEPDELLAGPRGRPRSQRVWFSDNDLSSPFDPFHPDFDIEKLACKFLLYEVQGEMCAAFVTLTDEGCCVPQRKLPPLQVVLESAESPSPKHHSEEPEGFEETDEEVPGFEEEVDPPAAEQAREGQQNARAFLQREVPEAVRVFEDAETTWSVSEMGKRMTKYFVGGLSAAAEKSDWRSSGKRFLEKGIRSFTNACGSRKWFNDAEEVLKPLLAHATWEVVQDCENAYEATEELTRELVDQAYLDMWEYQNFDVAVQDAVRRSFKDQSGAVQQKVMQALARTHQGAEKESVVEGNLLRQIEVFTETWVNHSMDRACTMINSELLDEETVVQLFRFLLHPEFSKTYSCVPASLRKNGRPPRGWKFLRPCVQEMLRRWAEAQGVAPQRGGERRTSRSPGRPFVRKRPMPSQLRER